MPAIVEPLPTTTPYEHDVTPPPPRLRIIVADDHPLYRAGIVRALESTEAFDVVAEAADGRDALDLIRTLVPDVALLDVRMPGIDGIDVVAALARYGPNVPVVLLSAFDDEPLVRAGLEAGSATYLVKSASREEICLEVAAAAHAAVDRSPAALHGSASLGPQRPAHWHPRLTVDQHRLLGLAAAGRTRQELAVACGLDEPALRRRIDDLLARMGADSLEEAIAQARLLGLVGRQVTR